MLGGGAHTGEESAEGLLVAGSTAAARDANKWTEKMLAMTELGPGDTAVADSKMAPAEMRLLCTLLGNNTIHAQTLLLAGLWLACTQRTLARSWRNFTFKYTECRHRDWRRWRRGTQQGTAHKHNADKAQSQGYSLMINQGVHVRENTLSIP